MPPEHAGRPPIRLCLDLNIWCGDLLSRRRGDARSAAQLLVDAARKGHCPLGPVQLIVSWGMLNRLRMVWIEDANFRLDPAMADALISLIADYARIGPGRGGPQLTLGGVGIMPMRDEEDAHVLDTAIAAADMLATVNFRDFMLRDAEILRPGRLARLAVPGRAPLLIVHPYVLADWFAAGAIQL